MSTQHTPGPWKQGITLTTPQTQRWSDAERTANDEIEKRKVFSGFSHLDGGRRRKLIAVCETKEDARLISEAPNLAKLGKAVVDCWKDPKDYGDEGLLRLQIAIDQLEAAIAKATEVA